MRLQDAFELVLLAAIWGSSFLFMRTATPEFGAISLVAVRTSIAALCLLPFLMMSKQVKTVTSYWRQLLFLGVINTALPFCLFSYSTVQIGAGFAAILNATAPMFGALIAFLWLREKLTLWAVGGLVLGFVGVLVTTNARSADSFYLAIMPILAALGATCSYGIAVCYTRKWLAGVNALAIATGSQIFAATALAPLAFLTWPAVMPSTSAWLQVLVMAVVCSAFAYILYFRLIANVGPTKALSVGYLVTVFGVMWGMLFLGETINSQIVIGALLIMFGVSLTTGVIKQRQKAEP
ncbi:DMT family transporter [Aestuariibacter sp. AA17]|uniref:DMT family transporter n=1 Tax=Fluctibacter corallii TaxID=2984329 RepID=A0ABT3AAJ8_9ALTE|nr:DMT family transporter [Aestuariibacter sp. AA17]MCV2885698.1 DMT family transporter [Aestuariibacter sp. AA17]